MFKLLLWLLVFFGLLGAVTLWRALTTEQRKNKKELERITQRLEVKERMEKMQAQDDSQAIAWSQVTEIIDNLQIASGQSKGTKALEDLAHEARAGNLDIKKHGEIISIDNLSELQDLIDTYDPYIKVASYIDAPDQYTNSYAAEYVPKNSQLTVQQKAYLEFSEIISQGHVEVRNELSLYFDDPRQYLNKFYFDLAQRGIEKAEQLRDIVVLVDALARQKKVVYSDYKTELFHALDQLNNISQNKLSRAGCYRDLQQKAQVSLVRLSVLEEDRADSLFACVQANGFNLIAIDEGFDVYVVSLVSQEQTENILALANKANIKLGFTHRI